MLMGAGVLSEEEGCVCERTEVYRSEKRTGGADYLKFDTTLAIYLLELIECNIGYTARDDMTNSGSFILEF